MNVCTYGYSLAFIPWDASDTDPKAQSWVKHIDWMALQGINVRTQIAKWINFFYPNIILFQNTCIKNIGSKK